jgi:hypothetical protein
LDNALIFPDKFPTSGARPKKQASFTVRAGSVEIPIYFRRVSKKGRPYPEWTVVH